LRHYKFFSLKLLINPWCDQGYLETVDMPGCEFQDITGCDLREIP